MQNEADGSALLVWILAVGAAPIRSGRANELWTLQGPDQPQVSLGLASAAARTYLALPAALEKGTEFVVSVEAAGGLLAAGPTGPVLFVGGLVRPANN